MALIAKIVVEISLDREFDYRIPSHLQDSIRVGSQVEVPFKSRELRGFVVGLANHSAFGDKLKEIARVVGDKPLIPDSVMKLAYWIADYYCAPIEAAVRTVLPSAVRKRGARHKKQLVVSLVDATNVDEASSLVRDEHQILPDPLHAQVESSRSAQPNEAGSLVYEKLPVKQRTVFQTLEKHGAMTLSELKERAGCSESPIRTLEKHGLVKIEEETILRDPHAGLELLRTKPFDLMVEQQTALETITASMDKKKQGVVLLHGVTGSGKTEVYLQAIQHALDRGQGAIVLVPEISLTPQTVDRFRSRFGDCVAVLHSSLSDGERHDEWHRIRNGEARIAIGARSALFSPIENPGLIVVDEEHEATYKQDEAPRYNARDVAVMRGHLENCCVVLGSATPAMESFHNVREGRYELAEMLMRVDDRSMPLMRVVDMRIEAEKEGRAHIFSAELVQAIYERLNMKEQVILFLNRRGFSSSLQCEQCGYVAECSECSVSMTYHKRAHKLLCHICGAEEKVPERCPKCGDPDFKYAGMGTERIEEVLEKLCPKAKVARMDSDTMRKKDSYRTVLDQFRTGKIDILLGTQMIAKGLDFPNVTLVGVLYADMSLNMPDFRAGERTFQLLTQVAGRAGRGEKAGEVIVQAYTPHHPAIQAARNLDYTGFCDQDLEFRRELSYPPFSHLVLLTFKGESEAEVVKVSDGFSQRLEKILPDSVLHSPPMPAPLARAKGQWRYQIMLRCKHTVKMTKPIRHVLSAFKMPKTVTCTVDVDALSLL